MHDVEIVGTLGRALSRPESVLCTKSGDVFASHKSAAFTHIRPNGEQAVVGHPPSGIDFVANGLCLLRDGAMLVANVGATGGIWLVNLAGDIRPFLLEADGVALSAANSITQDGRGRLWISVSTRTMPRNAVYNTGIADGFLVLVDDRGARIVADGLAFTNESRLSNDGTGLFVCETAARRVHRFEVRPDGALANRAIFAELGPGSFADGCAFDAEGHLWVACIVSNRLIRIAPDGSHRVVAEDSSPEYVAAVEAAMAKGIIRQGHFYDDTGTAIKALTSLAFSGHDLRTIYLGSLTSDTLTKLRSPFAGREPAHWHFRRPFPV